MNWIQLELVCAASRVNDFKAILDDYGHGGCVVEELPEEEGLTGSLSCLRAYLPVSRKYRAVQTEIVEKLRKAGYQGGLKEQRLKQNEWFASLKQDFKESDVGDRFIIRPSWSRKKSVPPGRTLLKIDPGAAFGTGLHPTTRLCLQELEKHIKRSYTVFDLGTGTGILAIAAAKLGAGAIYACDIDAVAVKTAAANAVMNSVTGITFKRGSLGSAFVRRNKNGYDIVLANITARTICLLTPNIVKIMKPGGILIVSGIHPEGLDEVLISFALADLKLLSLEREEQWYSVTAKRKK